MIVFRITNKTYNYMCILYMCTISNFAIRYLKVEVLHIVMSRKIIFMVIIHHRNEIRS